MDHGRSVELREHADRDVRRHERLAVDVRERAARTLDRPADDALHRLVDVEPVESRADPRPARVDRSSEPTKATCAARDALGRAEGWRRSRRCAAAAAQSAPDDGDERSGSARAAIRPRRAARRPDRRPSRSPPARGRRPAGAARARASPRSGRRTRRSDARARSAPPLTLTIVSSTPSIRVELHATDANASLISTRATSSIVRAAAASAASAPRPGCARGTRTRRRPSPGRRSAPAARARAALANSSEQTTTHEAPSFTPGALPAVVVPSGSKTGFSEASFSRVVSRRIHSSATTSPTATISSSKRPASCAAAARSCERSAQAS